MTSRQWTIAGVVAALVLLLGGILIGHLLSSSSDAERQAWEARTDSLLGAQRQRFQALTDSLHAEAARREAAASAAADSALVAERGRAVAEANAARLRRLGDSLTAALDSARTAGDSLPVYVALVDNLTAQRDSAEARANSEQRIAAQWKSGYQAEVEAAGLLRAQLRMASERIDTLETQLAHYPKHDRWKLTLWGADVRPGAAVIYGLDRQVEVGVGLVVTP